MICPALRARFGRAARDEPGRARISHGLRRGQRGAGLFQTDAPRSVWRSCDFPRPARNGERVAPNSASFLARLCAESRAGAGDVGLRTAGRSGWRNKCRLGVRDHRANRFGIGSSPVFPLRRTGLMEIPSRQGCIKLLISSLSSIGYGARAGRAEVRFDWFSSLVSSPHSFLAGKRMESLIAALPSRPSFRFLLDSSRPHRTSPSVTK